MWGLKSHPVRPRNDPRQTPRSQPPQQNRDGQAPNQSQDGARRGHREKIHAAIAQERRIEILCRSGDIRIPLGVPFEPDPQLTMIALEMLTGPFLYGFMPLGRLRGLSRQATDIDRNGATDRKSVGGQLIC